MTNFDQSKAPYYVRELSEDYTQLLFVPGMHLQNAELNELQTNLKRITKGIGDCILTDGDIRSGAQLIIDGNNVTVTDGLIYLEGIVRQFKQQTVQITGEGIEIIGVKLRRKAITHLDDKKLLSPAEGFENYGLAGAHRLEEVMILTVNDPDAATLYVLKDGKLVNEAQVEDNSLWYKLLALLARRTYDESGHYKVRGMELSQKNQYDEDNLYVSLSEGKAYVEGWEIDKQTATTIQIPRSISIRSIKNEPKVYRSTESNYKLNNHPASTVNRVTALIQKKLDLTRQGAVNGSDPVPSAYTPVVDTLEVKDNTTGVIYQKNTDYVLEADTIRWLAGGKQPDIGRTYNVTLTYNKILILNQDYSVGTNNGEYAILFMQGDKPVESSQILIDYDFYLHYYCTVVLDKNGLASIVAGQPDTKDKVAPPDIADRNVLVLGNVLVAPKNDNLTIFNTRNIRSEMSRIQWMYERLEDSEINQAITDLDKEAIDGEGATTLKGVLTDGFAGWTKADINHRDFSAAIDPVSRSLTAGYTPTIHGLQVDALKSQNASIHSRLATAKGDYTVNLFQPYATRSSKINPYSVFLDNPSITISPAMDSWIDEDSVTIQRDGGTTIKSKTITSSTLSSGTTSTTSTRTSESVSVLDTAIEYMRPIQITVTAKKFLGHQRGIRIKFNDVLVQAKGVTTAYDDVSGTLKADADGVVKATFTIPKGIRCGTVMVKISADDFPNKEGITSFTAQGVLKTSITTVTTTKVINRTIVRPRNVDPLAQTFEFADDQMLMAVGGFFSVKDQTHPVTVQIRETDNGYPSSVIMAEKILNPADLKISNDASVETVIEFDDPVYCRGGVQYAFTVMSESDTDAMWFQELGKTDVKTGEIVVRNPYIDGVMFSSSNNQAWTAHHTANLKFNIYCKNCQEISEVYFHAIAGVDYDRIRLNAATSVPIGTSLVWEYSSDQGSSWLPLPINRSLELSRSLDNITVRAILTSIPNMSPAIALDSLILDGAKNYESSSYVSRNVTTDVNFTQVKVIADVYAPSGTGVVFYYATDISGTTWKPLTQQGNGIVLQVGGFTEYTYTATETAQVKNFRVKAVLTTNNSVIRPIVQRLKCIMK